MTREQRLELLKQIEKDIYVPSIESTFLDEAKSCAIHSAIVELEQESVLDNIRAKIMELDKRLCSQWLIEDTDKERHRAYQECISIVNKYMRK